MDDPIDFRRLKMWLLHPFWMLRCHAIGRRLAATIAEERET